MVFPCLSQETISSLGIFDATADWRLSSFSLQKGDYKIPGYVLISKIDIGYVYDIFGNGNDIMGQFDEGLFLYANKEGSWSLSAFLEWMNSENIDIVNAKAGIMIREYPDQSDSRYWTVQLERNQTQAVTLSLETLFRLETGQPTYSDRFYYTKPRRIFDSFIKGIWLRLICIDTFTVLQMKVRNHSTQVLGSISLNDNLFQMLSQF